MKERERELERHRDLEWERERDRNERDKDRDAKDTREKRSSKDVCIILKTQYTFKTLLTLLYIVSR